MNKRFLVLFIRILVVYFFSASVSDRIVNYLIEVKKIYSLFVSFPFFPLKLRCS